MIYFLKTKENGYVKIGYTKFKDLVRFRTIDAGHPFDGEIILFIEGSLKEEKELHNLFKKHKVENKNEWFHLCAEIDKFIDENKDNSIDVPNFSVERKKGLSKTNPIGVRFNTELLNTLKNAQLVNTPQGALSLYEKSYLELIELKVLINNQHENKERILKERETPNKAFQELKQQSEQNEIPRLKGESSIEYRLRMIEENKK